MDASYKIQRGIHVHLIQFFMCPEFWVHINRHPPLFCVRPGSTEGQSHAGSAGRQEKERHGKQPETV